MSDSIAFYTGIKGEHYGEITVNAVMSEGYPTGDLVIRGMRIEHLQQFADWALTLPEEIYKPIEQAARATEQYLLSHSPTTGVRR